jgi:hypothetical protein
VYDTLFWLNRTRNAGPATSHRAGGTVRVERTEGCHGAGPDYAVTVQHDFEPGTRTLTYRCHADPLGSVREFSAQCVSGGSDGLVTEDSGTVSGERVIVNGRKAPVLLDGPLLESWFIPMLLMRGELAEPLRASVIHEGAGIHPGQCIQRRRTIQVALAEGETESFEVWARHGPGTLPVYYLVDQRRIPQFAICGMVSWALREVV